MSPGSTSKDDQDEDDVTDVLVVSTSPADDGGGGSGQQQQLCSSIHGSNSNSKAASTDNRTLRDKLGDTDYRERLMYSLCIAFLFFCTALVDSQRGIAFLDLQLITETNLEQASKLFSVNSLGYMAGTLLSGVLAKKINRNLLIFLGLLVASCAFTSLPHCRDYYVMLAVNCVVGLNTGMAETTSNAEQMRLWGDQGKTLIHVIHLGYYLGGIIVPFYTEPFLAKALPSRNNRTHEASSTLNSSVIPSTPSLLYSSAASVSTNYTLSQKDAGSTSNSNGSDAHNVDIDQAEYGSSQIHFAFIITGGIIFCCSLPFLVIFLRNLRRAGKMENSGETEKKKTAHSSRKTPLSTRILIVMGVSLYFMLYCSLGDVFPHFLMAFLVNEFHTISKSQAAYISAVFWVSSAVASCVLIGVSKLLIPVQTAGLCVTAMAVSMAAFMTSAFFRSTVAMTIFTATLGASSSGFGAGLAWCESELIHVREFMSSIIFFSSSFGVLISPLILGVLIERFSNMWYCYALEIQTVILCLTYCGLFAFNRLHVNKKYGLLHAKEEIVISGSEGNVKSSQGLQRGDDGLIGSTEI